MLKLAFVAALLGGTLVYGLDDYMCHTLLALDCSQRPHDPVCGTDRHTYSNDCELAQAHCRHTYVHQFHTGACVTVKAARTSINGAIIVQSIMCSKLSYMECGVTVSSADEKVCCTNGITYPNFCEYEKYRCNHPSVSVANLGQCTPARTTGDFTATTVAILNTSPPVTSTIGPTVVYGQGRDYYVCRTLLSLDCATRPTDPICGTDRKTYTNDCNLAQAHCRHTYVHQLHTGACVPVDNVIPTMSLDQLKQGPEVVASVMCSYLGYMDCGVTASSADENVCCTNGITYPNFCEYEKYRCNHRSVGVANIGQCAHA